MAPPTSSALKASIKARYEALSKILAAHPSKTTPQIYKKILLLVPPPCLRFTNSPIEQLQKKYDPILRSKLAVIEQRFGCQYLVVSEPYTSSSQGEKAIFMVTKENPKPWATLRSFIEKFRAGSKTLHEAYGKDEKSQELLRQRLEVWYREFGKALDAFYWAVVTREMEVIMERKEKKGRGMNDETPIFNVLDGVLSVTFRGNGGSDVRLRYASPLPSENLQIPELVPPLASAPILAQPTISRQDKELDTLSESIEVDEPSIPASTSRTNKPTKDQNKKNETQKPAKRKRVQDLESESESEYGENNAKRRKQAPTLKSKKRLESNTIEVDIGKILPEARNKTIQKRKRIESSISHSTHLNNEDESEIEATRPRKRKLMSRGELKALVSKSQKRNRDDHIEGGSEIEERVIKKVKQVEVGSQVVGQGIRKNPRRNPGTYDLKTEYREYWISKGWRVGEDGEWERREGGEL